MLQGVGGALLTPGSLAMIQGAFARRGPGAGDRRLVGAGRHRGRRSARSSAACSIDYATWRWIFLINLPLAVSRWCIARALGARDPRPARARATSTSSARVLASLALGGTDVRADRVGQPGAPWAASAGRRRGGRLRRSSSAQEHPMMPLGLFATAPSAPQPDDAAGVRRAGRDAVLPGHPAPDGQRATARSQAGVATLPITLCMLFLAARGGALGARIGPRIPMTVGPLVMAAGTLLAAAASAPDVAYWTDVLPGPDRLRPRAGADGRAVDRDRAGRRARRARRHRQRRQQRGRPRRLALAVAALPVAVGLGGEEYADPVAFDAAYGSAMLACAALLAVGGVVSWLTIPRRMPSTRGLADGSWIRAYAGPRRGSDDASTTPARRGGGRCARRRPGHGVQRRRPRRTAGEPRPSAPVRPSARRRAGRTTGRRLDRRPVADPEHAVDPPGKRTGTLVGPDLRSSPRSRSATSSWSGSRQPARGAGRADLPG